MLNKDELDIKIGGDYDPIPEDKYTVQIIGVAIKVQFNTYKGADQNYLNWQYAVLDDNPMPESEETTRDRYLWHRTSQSLNSKSWLFKMVKAVYGRDLTKEELEAFAEDPECIIGRQVNVMVNQNPSKDGATIYNNIVSYSKCLKKLEPYMEVEAVKTLEKESSPLGEKTVDVPDLNPDGLDFEDAFAEKEKAKPEAKSDTGDGELDEILDSEVTEEDAEILEMELKLKKAKAKAAKAAKAKKAKK